LDTRVVWFQEELYYRTKADNLLHIVRFIGVADIAAVRFSLPANLLEPTPNLGMLLFTGLSHVIGFCLETMSLRALFRLLGLFG
jgi:hypothetical protein